MLVLILRKKQSRQDCLSFQWRNAFKRGCQHPSNKFEILWQVAQDSFPLLLSFFVAQYILIINVGSHFSHLG